MMGLLFRASSWCQDSPACTFRPLPNAPKIVASEVLPLHEAASAGDLAKVRASLAGPSSVLNAQDRDGETPAIKAAKNGRLKVLECLIAASANLEICDLEGWSVLHFIAQEGHLVLVGVVLDRSPILLNKRDKRGLTPLHVAVWCGNEPMTRRLLSEGADASATTNWGESPLHHAVYFGHATIAELLLNAGGAHLADQEDKMKRTPRSLALNKEKLKALFLPR
jgi:ankyrin repeat/protein kinase domain-containing protein 1